MTQLVLTLQRQARAISLATAVLCFLPALATLLPAAPGSAVSASVRRLRDRAHKAFTPFTLARCAAAINASGDRHP